MLNIFSITTFSLHRRSSPFQSSSRPSGTATSSLPQQQRSPARRGSWNISPLLSTTRPPPFFPLPFFCKRLPDWSATPPADSHCRLRNLDLVRYTSLPSPLISQSHLKLSLPIANERTAHSKILQPIGRKQLVALKIIFPPLSTFPKDSRVLPTAGMMHFYLSG